jgi:ABC-type sugar transport system permease subunit
MRIMVPLLWPTVINLVILDFIGKMKQFALVWVMTRGGPMWGTETVATYVVKRAFEWKTLDLGYPSAIAVIWFVIIFGLSLLLTRVLQRREALEF